MQANFTLPADLMAQLKAQADKEHRSFSNLVTKVLIEYLENLNK